MVTYDWFVSLKRTVPSPEILILGAVLFPEELELPPPIPELLLKPLELPGGG